MTAKSATIGVLAILAIGGSAYFMVGGKSRGKPKLGDESRAWLLLSMVGRYRCPHCEAAVKLTDEQLMMPHAPKLVCPQCGKPVDIVKLVAPQPAGAGEQPGKTP